MVLNKLLTITFHFSSIMSVLLQALWQQDALQRLYYVYLFPLYTIVFLCYTNSSAPGCDVMAWKALLCQLSKFT